MLFFSLQRFLLASRNWIGLILARIIFLVLAILSIGLAVSRVINTNKYISLLFVPLILLIFEFIVTLKFKGCKEWKWLVFLLMVLNISQEMSDLLLCLVPLYYIYNPLAKIASKHFFGTWMIPRVLACERLKGIPNFPALSAYWLKSHAICHTCLIQNLETNNHDSRRKQIKFLQVSQCSQWPCLSLHVLTTHFVTTSFLYGIQILFHSAKFFFSGSFFYVYIENPKPKKPRRPTP